MKHIDFTFVVDTFLLLLIGVGPKIALVPYLEMTSSMDAPTKSRVTRKMFTTAAIVSVMLLLLGELLARLLHFTTSALSVAGGIILLIIAVTMVLSPSDSTTNMSAKTSDPMQLAVYPLAVPYLLNPVGIVALVTLSSDSASWSTFGVVAGLLIVVLLIDVVTFRWAKGVSDHLDESRMLVTEKVFGFLLAAVAVQLVLDGLARAGVIHLKVH